jgi:hypothetical protein
MLKLKVVMIKIMLLIKKKLKRNLKSILRIQSMLRKISLLMNMVVRENLGCKKPMPFPNKRHKSKEEEHYNKFCEWMKPLFLQIALTDAIKLPPYSKYMKDIVSNTRKIPNDEISTLLSNYSFNGKVL